MVYNKKKAKFVGEILKHLLFLKKKIRQKKWWKGLKFSVCGKEDKSTIIKKTRNIFAENIEENKITKLRLQKWNVAPRKKKQWLEKW